jgi:hypothetical protein
MPHGDVAIAVAKDFRKAATPAHHGPWATGYGPVMEASIADLKTPRFRHVALDGRRKPIPASADRSAPPIARALRSLYGQCYWKAKG